VTKTTNPLTNVEERYLEDSFPIKEVSIESSREKTIRHGHISTLHMWWARRPLASSRATIYGALTPSSDLLKEKIRKAKFIVEIAKWENSHNASLLGRARREILEANDNEPPRILDPFAGGGSIPLEALRLGCETYASDYNPVATLILKCTLEYPQKYYPSQENAIGRSISLRSDAKDNPLLADVKKWGEWVLEESGKEIERFYPHSQDAWIPVAYIWARTVHCQNPSCRAEIPLMRQYWLARKPNKKIALFPYSSGKKISFKIVGSGYDEMPQTFRPEKGTVLRAIVTCPVCGSTMDSNTLRTLFKEGKAGQMIVAVVLNQKGTMGKKYRAASVEDVEVFNKAEEYLN
jgi:putative DNA methylase